MVDPGRDWISLMLILTSCLGSQNWRQRVGVCAPQGHKFYYYYCHHYYYYYLFGLFGPNVLIVRCLYSTDADCIGPVIPTAWAQPCCSIRWLLTVKAEVGSCEVLNVVCYMSWCCTVCSCCFRSETTKRDIYGSFAGILFVIACVQVAVWWWLSLALHIQGQTRATFLHRLAQFVVLFDVAYCHSFCE